MYADNDVVAPDRGDQCRRVAAFRLPVIRCGGPLVRVIE
jgi:hypothetical protein